MRGKRVTRYRVLDKINITRRGISHEPIGINIGDKLDTWGNPIARVSEIIPLGAFNDSLTSYWNNATGKFDLAAPPAVNLGDVVGVALYGENTGSVNQRMYMSISIYSPSGKEYFTSSVEQVAYPGSYIPFFTDEVANEVGDWTAEATLYGEVA